MKEQVYKKVGRKYVKLSYSDGWQGFPTDGIWLVQTTPGMKSSECILKIADNETVIPYAANFIKYKEQINKYLIEHKDVHLVNTSINKFTEDLLKYITNIE